MINSKTTHISHICDCWRLLCHWIKIIPVDNCCKQFQWYMSAEHSCVFSSRLQRSAALDRISQPPPVPLYTGYDHLEQYWLLLIAVRTSSCNVKKKVELSNCIGLIAASVNQSKLWWHRYVNSKYLLRNKFPKCRLYSVRDWVEMKHFSVFP